MRREPRARGREEDDERDEDALAEPEPLAPGHGLAFELARAVEAANAPRVITLLGGHVRLREGVTLSNALGDGGVDLVDVEPAELSAGYRDAATHPLSRALGVERTARVLVDLLRRARDLRSVEPATRALAASHGHDHALVHAMERDARTRAPDVLAALGDIAPDVVRMTSHDVRQLARAGQAAIEAAMPRLALGLPGLDGKSRRAAEDLLHAIAPVEHEYAPRALAALLRAGAVVDRRRDGLTPIERAATASVLANLRVFENAGARLDKATKKRVQREGKASRGVPKTSKVRPSTPPPTHTKAVEKRRAKETPKAGLSTGAKALLLAAGALGLAFFIMAEPRIGFVLLGIGATVLAVMAKLGRSLRWFRAADDLRDRRGDRWRDR